MNRKKKHVNEEIARIWLMVEENCSLYSETHCRLRDKGAKPRPLMNWSLLFLFIRIYL
jgi:hypothetical protein